MHAAAAQGDAEMARTRRRRLLGISAAIVAAGALGTYGYTVFAKPETTVDPSRVVKVERGDLARSVVATGKIEPIAKVEI